MADLPGSAAHEDTGDGEVCLYICRTGHLPGTGRIALSKKV